MQGIERCRFGSQQFFIKLQRVNLALSEESSDSLQRLLVEGLVNLVLKESMELLQRLTWLLRFASDICIPWSLDVLLIFACSSSNYRVLFRVL